MVAGMRRVLVLAVLAVLLSSCVGYYGQAIRGQWELLRKPEPIDEILAENSTPESLKAQLRIAQKARLFATQRLDLPDNKSYTEYADLERPFVVWSVVATPKYSLTPERWCFPVAGCVSYRGYFKKQGAEKFAAKLEKKGLDVSVGGVPAYSTLGRFSDPVLNTMLRRGELGLVAIVFHELAHQKLYVKGDTRFNEAFATAVEEEGIRLWLSETGADQDQIDSYYASRKRRVEFIALLKRTQEKLATLYEEPLDIAAKEKKKQAIFDGLQTDYQSIKAGWDGYGGYDAWFSRDLNNAHLASVSNYESLLPAFRVLIKEVNGDMSQFYSRCQALSDLDQESRNREVQKLLQDARKDAGVN